MDSSEETIVFKVYSNELEASVALVELQVDGIEGYLTNENSQDLFVPEVRLHIFSRDYDRVNKILIEDKIKCPYCGGKNWQALSAWRKTYFSLLLMLDLKSGDSNHEEYHCLNCNRYF
ncbi:MAG TPA: hypothetical protein VGQ59_09695 [Cyclobacteriaceae bacterium]|jgi:DNA-directed RNA polymerase subunit RPC12/RpoP|nr:hypothetical protein [Cyclobacteriaceae bacterium]